MIARVLLITLAIRAIADESVGCADSVGSLHPCDSDEDESALLQTGQQSHLLARKSPKQSPEDLREVADGFRQAADVLEQAVETLKSVEGSHVNVDFKVLVVAPPRSGTQSIEAGLTELGFNPLHSGHDLWIRPRLCNFVSGNGSFNEAMDLMGDHDSGMDEPFHLIYEEVMSRWPKSKFILTPQNAEHWYEAELEWGTDPESYEPPTDTGVESAFTTPGQAFQKVTGAVSECLAARYWGCDFLNRPVSAKAECIKNYNAHYENVQKKIPADRLLMLDFSKGYGPLAEFLGVEAPTFPNGTIKPIPYEDSFHKHPESHLMKT